MAFARTEDDSASSSEISHRVEEGRTDVRGPSRRCGGGFAEQVAGKIEKGEASTFLRARLEIRLDENLDGLFAA
jgi:hypothetical protein